MKHLNGIDHMFWALETNTTTGVLGGLIRFDPPEDDRRPDEAFMRDRIAERIGMIPPLRWRMIEMPVGLGHGYLADTQRIDLHHHIRTSRLPSPGTDEQLTAEIARLMELPLDKTRPLWELIVFEGLQDGSIAHLLRTHHVVLDGGSMPVLMDLIADEPINQTDPSWAATERIEPAGGSAEMLARGLASTIAQPVHLIKLTATLVGWYGKRLKRDLGTTFPAAIVRMLPGELAKPGAALINLRQKAAGRPLVQPLVPRLRAPSTPFNQKVTSRRAVVYADLSLAELKGIGKPLGFTLNDVVVAMCAGALRRYLEDHGGVPKKPLILCVPVGLRDPKEPFRWANDISMIFCEFPTHLEDPKKRLEFAQRSVKDAKANLDEMPMEHYEQTARFISPQTFAIPSKIMSRMPRWVPSPATWNVVVSNVRGPAKDIHYAGNRIRGIWPTSFLSPVGGINITLQSYVDRVDFGIVACGDHIDDIETVVDAMKDELEVLKGIAAQSTKETAGLRAVPRRDADHPAAEDATPEGNVKVSAPTRRRR